MIYYKYLILHHRIINYNPYNNYTHENIHIYLKIHYIS